MKSKLTFRSLFVLASLISFFMLGFAYFLEYALNIEPCPLCLLQRYLLWVVFVSLTIGTIHNGKKTACLLYCITTCFFSLIGIILAARHVWLQYLAPPEFANCSAGLERMLLFKPLLEVLKDVLLYSSPECSRIDFTFLKLSLPIWSLLSFTGFAVFGVFVGWLKTKRRI